MYTALWGGHVHGPPGFFLYVHGPPGFFSGALLPSGLLGTIQRAMNDELNFSGLDTDGEEDERQDLELDSAEERAKQYAKHVELHRSQLLPHLKLRVLCDKPWDKTAATDQLIAKPVGAFLLWRHGRSTIMLSYHSSKGGSRDGTTLASSAPLGGDGADAVRGGLGAGSGSVKHLKIFITCVYQARRVRHVYKLESRPNIIYSELGELISALPFLHVQKQADSASASTMFPEWLARRRDFSAAFPRFTTSTHTALDRPTLAALRVERGFRTPDHLGLLIRWLKKFTSLDLSKVATLCEVAGHQYLGAGRTLFREGDVADAFYILFAGVVQVVVGDETLAEMHCGDGFGEHGLEDEEGPRSRRLATVRCATGCKGVHLIRISRSDYVTSLLIYHRARRRRLMHWLRHSLRRSGSDGNSSSMAAGEPANSDSAPPLAHWSLPKFFKLASSADQKTFRRGEVLVAQGEPASSCAFFVRRGILALQKEVISVASVRFPVPNSAFDAATADGRSGDDARTQQADAHLWHESHDSVAKLVTVRTLREGDWFGFEALPPKKPRRDGVPESSLTSSQAAAAAAAAARAAASAPAPLRAFTVVCRSEACEVVMVLPAAFSLFDAKARALLAAGHATDERCVDVVQMREVSRRSLNEQIATHRGPLAVRRAQTARLRKQLPVHSRPMRNRVQQQQQQQQQQHQQAGRGAKMKGGQGIDNTPPWRQKLRPVERHVLKRQSAVTARDGTVLEWREHAAPGASSRFDGVLVRSRAQIEEAVRATNAMVRRRAVGKEGGQHGERPHSSPADSRGSALSMGKANASASGSMLQAVRATDPRRLSTSLQRKGVGRDSTLRSVAMADSACYMRVRELGQTKSTVSREDISTIVSTRVQSLNPVTEGSLGDIVNNNNYVRNIDGMGSTMDLSGAEF